MELIFEKGFLYIKIINCFIGVIPGADHRKWVFLHGTFSININSAQSASSWFWRGYINETGSSLTHRLHCCNTVLPYQALQGDQLLRGFAGLHNIIHSKKTMNMYHVYTYEFEICSWEITHVPCDNNKVCIQHWLLCGVSTIFIQRFTDFYFTQTLKNRPKAVIEWLLFNKMVQDSTVKTQLIR